jgi:hypothetical protein
VVGSHLYVANLGDSRVVLGTAKYGGKGEMVALRLSREHNAGNPEVREELRAQHPHDPDIVKLSYGVWRVKGIIQVSREASPSLEMSPTWAGLGFSRSFLQGFLGFFQGFLALYVANAGLEVDWGCASQGN